jgi:hypothetical protein
MLKIRSGNIMRTKLFTIALTLGLARASAKDKHPKQDPQDEIRVVAHVPLTSGPIQRFLTTQHYSRTYLYAEQDGGKSVTLLDVTKASHPRVLAEMSYGPGQADSLFFVTGTAAIVVASQPASQPVEPQMLRILNFADPLHPKVSREFTGVTAMMRDDARGLIFLANAEGVWILHQQLATDPEVEAAFEHHVLYDH